MIERETGTAGTMAEGGAVIRMILHFSVIMLPANFGLRFSLSYGNIIVITGQT